MFLDYLFVTALTNQSIVCESKSDLTVISVKPYFISNRCQSLRKH